jgi:ribosomal protein L29
MLMRKSELNALSKEELMKRLSDLELSLIKERARRQEQGSKIKIREIKRTIARIKTILKVKHNISV